MGKTLYDELISQVENDNVTDENEILIDNYIQKIIVYFVMGEVVFNTAYKLKKIREWKMVIQVDLVN